MASAYTQHFYTNISQLERIRVDWESLKELEGRPYRNKLLRVASSIGIKTLNNKRIANVKSISIRAAVDQHFRRRGQQITEAIETGTLPEVIQRSPKFPDTEVAVTFPHPQLDLEENPLDVADEAAALVPEEPPIAAIPQPDWYSTLGLRTALDQVHTYSGFSRVWIAPVNLRMQENIEPGHINFGMLGWALNPLAMIQQFLLRRHKADGVFDITSPADFRPLQEYLNAIRELYKRKDALLTWSFISANRPGYDPVNNPDFVGVEWVYEKQQGQILENCLLDILYRQVENKAVAKKNISCKNKRLKYLKSLDTPDGKELNNTIDIAADAIDRNIIAVNLLGEVWKQSIIKPKRGTTHILIHNKHAIEYEEQDIKMSTRVPIEMPDIAAAIMYDPSPIKQIFRQDDDTIIAYRTPTGQFRCPYQNYLSDYQLEELPDDFNKLIAPRGSKPPFLRTFRDFFDADHDADYHQKWCRFREPKPSDKLYKADKNFAYGSWATGASKPYFNKYGFAPPSTQRIATNDITYIEKPGRSYIINTVYNTEFTRKTNRLAPNHWYENTLLKYYLDSKLATFDIAYTQYSLATPYNSLPFSCSTEYKNKERLRTEIGKLIQKDMTCKYQLASTSQNELEHFMLACCSSNKYKFLSREVREEMKLSRKEHKPAKQEPDEEQSEDYDDDPDPKPKTPKKKSKPPKATQFSWNHRGDYILEEKLNWNQETNNHNKIYTAEVEKTFVNKDGSTWRSYSQNYDIHSQILAYHEINLMDAVHKLPFESIIEFNRDAITATQEIPVDYQKGITGAWKREKIEHHSPVYYEGMFDREPCPPPTVQKKDFPRCLKVTGGPGSGKSYHVIETIAPLDGLILTRGRKLRDKYRDQGHRAYCHQQYTGRGIKYPKNLRAATIIIDDCGLINKADFDLIMGRAFEHGSNVIITCDFFQLKPQIGEYFDESRYMELFNTIELDTMHRFTCEQQKQRLRTIREILTIHSVDFKREFAQVSEYSRPAHHQKMRFWAPITEEQIQLYKDRIFELKDVPTAAGTIIVSPTHKVKDKHQSDCKNKIETIESQQGSTVLEDLVIIIGDIWSMSYDPCLFYTAVSRSPSIDKLWIVISKHSDSAPPE